MTSSSKTVVSDSAQQKIVQVIATELGVGPHQVAAAVALLDEGSTVPFVARYRKEVTGNLDDTHLRTLEERLRYLRELEERRAAILASIEEQGKLTTELRGTIESVRGTHFWAYVIGVLPRGAGPDAERPGFIRYSLEGSLWMVFYELAAHVRTIQRMKAQIAVPVKVVATGGLAVLFQQHTHLFDAVDGDLTLRGLAILYARREGGV